MASFEVRLAGRPVVGAEGDVSEVRALGSGLSIPRTCDVGGGVVRLPDATLKRALRDGNLRDLDEATLNELRSLPVYMSDHIERYRVLHATGGLVINSKDRIAFLAALFGCPVRVTDAESEAVATDWLLERGYLKEQT